jgi:hypothetical protein
MAHTILYPKTRTTKRSMCCDKTIWPPHYFAEIEEIFYETSIDIEALHALAKKAVGNASLTAKDGPLKVRVLAKRKVEAQ